MGEASAKCRTNYRELPRHRTSGPLRPRSAPRNVSPTQVLVTEQEVAFATAAAISIPPAATRRRLGSRLIVAIGRIHIGLPEPAPHYPRRERNYFEAARMSRELDHL
jgi:hypothetical protein